MQAVKEKQSTDIVALSRLYGDIPKAPVHLSYTVEEIDPCFAAGKATRIQNKLLIDLGEKEIELPIVSIIPSKEEISPAIIFLSYDREIPNKFLPAEEIIDRGYAIFSLCMKYIS